MHVNEAKVQHNKVREQEYDRLPGQILQQPQVEWGIQREPDNKGFPRAWDENAFSTTYHWIWLTAGKLKERGKHTRKGNDLRNPLAGKLI